MTLTRSFIRNAAMTPQDARLMNMASITQNADATPRIGVLGGANISIVATTAAAAPMTVTVAAAEFATSKSKADGVPIFTNDGTVSVTINAAPGANSRITVIWVKHEDNTTGDAASLPIFGTTDGSAAASPTKPAIPTGALELATLQVFAGSTTSAGGGNVLTNTYKMTAARGGVVTVRSIAERDAWTAPAPVDGQIVEVAATSQSFQRVDGTVGWVHLFGKPIISTITFTGIYSGASSRVVEHGGRVALEGPLAATSASFAGNTAYSFGSIPAAKSPVATRRWMTMINNVLPAMITLTSAGALTITPSAGFTNTIDAPLEACVWLDKRLG